MALSSGLVIGFRRGKLRQRDQIPAAVFGLALMFTAGSVGAALCVVLVAVSYCNTPPPVGVWLVSDADLRAAVWLDAQRVVLRRPYRVIYRDEVEAKLFCLLRRRCFGLPS